MLRKLIHRPKWIVAIAGLLFFWLSHSEWLTSSHLWQRAEGALIDRRFLLRGEAGANPDIQLVGVGTSALQLDALAPEEISASPVLLKMREPWPWDRSIYAAILEKLMAAGAKTVVFDFVFASETDGDAVFAQALEKYRDRVAIGEMFADEKGEISGTRKLTPPNARLLSPGTESSVGLVDLQTDDEMVRRTRYTTSVTRETLDLPKLDPRIAALLRRRISSGQAPDNMKHITVVAAEKFAGAIAVPPPDEKTFISFQGPPGTYRAWPVEDLFVDALWRRKPFLGGLAVSNKIVIVGPMAEIFHDVHATPFGEMPGPEVQAQILSALLRGEWLLQSSNWTNFCLSLACMLAALLVCLKVPQAWLKALLLGGATAALFAGCQTAFTHGHTVVVMMPPLFCLVATGSFGIIFDYTLEQFDKRRYRSILDRFVSKNVANTILDDRRSLVEMLKGRKQPVTVLFSDIRGFTSMTEKFDAEKLVAQLNEYFAEMVGSVFENEGTLQKFIGDAIMAVWGDTHSHGIAEDARRAVTTALQMRAALVKLNGGWQDNSDRTKLAIGIGLNHGEVTVGYTGHPQRMEFTVLGDDVNLAARLESATKQFKTDILVGEEAEKLTREHFVYRRVDLLRLHGKTRPVEVFALLSDRSVPAPAWLAGYHEAVKLYRSRKFLEAEKAFRAINGEIGGGDFLCEMYLSRCAAYEISPPPEDWDGSLALSEK